ncbi:hypothetical protein MLD38_021215 [Melastoma candidum]|uniref:Uncharacterized protein n=1 Tax=Melastoma candidum TaxID=119954 RepID=A0ACB9QJ90_9MYRT|nr:hypothetical protein MLD38_021215 [Melastoma candidum]
MHVLHRLADDRFKCRTSTFVSAAKQPKVDNRRTPFVHGTLRTWLQSNRAALQKEMVCILRELYMRSETLT